MDTLFLLEDALDRKLTLEAYNVQRKSLLGNGKPEMVKLGLLLVVLFAAGVLLTSPMSIVAPTAATKALYFMGAGSIGVRVPIFFNGQPSRVSKLADDLGPVLYQAMSASAG